MYAHNRDALSHVSMRADHFLLTIGKDTVSDNVSIVILLLRPEGKEDGRYRLLLNILPSATIDYIRYCAF